MEAVEADVALVAVPVLCAEAAPAPPPSPVPTIGAALLGDASPLRLVEVAVSLQALATADKGVPDLLFEALVIGAQELERRRREQQLQLAPAAE